VQVIEIDSEPYPTPAQSDGTSVVIDLRDPVTIDPFPTSEQVDAPPNYGEAGPPQVSLAVLMPVFNEARTVRQAVQDVLSVHYPCPMELIVVNDGSTDETASILASLSDDRLTVLHHAVNRGKGAALKTAASATTGATHVVPFDADLEYSAADLLRLVDQVVDGRANVVFGSRRSGRSVPHQNRLYAIGNTVMTKVANTLYGSRLTDLHTCLKLVPARLFAQLPLLEEGFGLDTELTAWLLRSGAQLREVPISYRSRSRAEGKKISWRDSLVCFHLLFRIRLEDAPVLGGAA